jgi:hypothetical protein
MALVIPYTAPAAHPATGAANAAKTHAPARNTETRFIVFSSRRSNFPGVLRGSTGLLWVCPALPSMEISG